MMLKGLAESAALAAVVIGTLAGAVSIRAAGMEADRQKEYWKYCEEVGAEYNILPELLMAIIERESDGNADAVGAAGEIGLMQISPRWHTQRARDLGVWNLFDPEGNIRTGADYLEELFKEYGDVGTVLMVYNGSSDAIERGEKGDYTDYAESIMERAEELEEKNNKKIAPANTLASKKVLLNNKMH